jgi:hypothetical protein
MEHIAPQWWQAAGRQSEVSLSRQSGYVRDEANQNRGLSEEGILSRLKRRSARAPPIPWVVRSPRLHPLHVDRAADVLVVFGCAQPTALTRRCAGLSAGRLGTVALTPLVARVWIKACLTRLTRAFSDGTSHWPASPQAHDRYIAVSREENDEENASRSRQQQTEDADAYHMDGKRRHRLYDTFNLTAGEQFQVAADSSHQVRIGLWVTAPQTRTNHLAWTEPARDPVGKRPTCSSCCSIMAIAIRQWLKKYP